MIQIDQLTLKPLTLENGKGPELSMALVSELDSGRIQYGLWESGPGEMIFEFQWNETVYALEGRVDLMNLDTKDQVLLQAGGLMSFEKGSRWHWKIPWKFRKLFTLVE